MDTIILVSIALFGLSAYLTHLNNSFKENLRTKETTEKRIEYRKQVYQERKKTVIIICLLPLLFFLGAIVYGIVLDDEEDKKWLIELFIFLLLIGLMIYAVVSMLFMSFYKGNLSYFDKKTFLNENKDYVLYLRGFESDDYSSYHLNFRSKPNVFSEYQFTKILSKHCVCAAIGMTIEVDAPLGAKRIYADDATWKEDVRDLMEKSRQIIILINDSPSCIWELETAVDYLRKVVFIVDNREKYEMVQTAISNKIKLPQIRNEVKADNNVFYSIQYVDDNYICKGYNSSNGYNELVQTIL